VDGYFGSHAHGIFGKEPEQRRQLIAVPLAFPLRATGRADWIEASAQRALNWVYAAAGRRGLFWTRKGF
jgi:hypothetical protein